MANLHMEKCIGQVDATRPQSSPCGEQSHGPGSGFRLGATIKRDGRVSATYILPGPDESA